MFIETFATQTYVTLTYYKEIVLEFKILIQQNNPVKYVSVSLNDKYIIALNDYIDNNMTRELKNKDMSHYILDYIYYTVPLNDEIYS